MTSRPGLVGLVVSVSGYKIRGPGSIPGCAPILVCVFFSFFFNTLMINGFIYLVKWHHRNDRNCNSCTFYIELCMKPGWG